MPNPLIIGAGALIGGGVAKGAMHLGAWARRLSAESVIKSTHKLAEEKQALFNKEIAEVREDIRKRDQELVERFASVLKRYGNQLEEEEIKLPPDFVEKVKNIPLPRLPSIIHQSGHDALKKIFSSSVEVSPSHRYAISNSSQHPQLSMMASAQLGLEFLREGYADFKVAGENHSAALRFYESCEERFKTVFAALHNDSERISDFHEMINAYKWLFIRTYFIAEVLQSNWDRMWSRNKLAVLRAYGLYTEARTFNRRTLETL